MQSVRPTVWLMDAKGQRRGMVDPLAVDCVFRDSDVGSWSVEFDGSHFLAERVGPGWSVVISDGLVSMSGPVDSIVIEQSASAVTYKLSGKDELVRLRDRIVYPSPDKDADNQTDVSHWQMKGNACDVIGELIDVSIGSKALPYRKIPGVALDVSRGSGGHLLAHERLSNVLEVVTKLSRLGGVTVGGVRDSSNNIVYRVAPVRDLARQVRFFSQAGNGATGEISFNAPTATAVIVAAQGEGVDRNIRETREPDSWGRRIEVLKDRRDTGDDGAIDQTGVETLTEGAESAGASFSVNESWHLMFGREYGLGDKITLNAGGIVVSEHVRQATVKWDGFGRTVDLTIGEHDNADDANPSWVKYVKSLSSRVGGLESR